MKKIILIKYGELTTKKANRNLFINTLAMNVKEALKCYDVKIDKNRVRMFIEPKNDNEFDIIVNKLSKIFGIHGIVIAYCCDNNIDTIKNNVLEIVKSINFKTFKVETKRSNKNFPVPSMEFNNVIGGLILKNVPNKNKKYVKKQLEQLDHNFLDYICYWNKKTYLNGLQDGINLILFALVGDSYGA